MGIVGNKTLIFKKVPTSFPIPGEHLAVEDRPLDQTPPSGGVTIKILSSSLDPYQRGRMRDVNIKSYSPPYSIDGPITNDCIASILKSDISDFSEGDLVAVGRMPIAEYAVVTKDEIKNVRKVSNPHDLDLGLFLGPLGMPGLTAYSSMHQIGKPKKGETIFVSSAAGAVGQVVGQIAKSEGLTVIGSVGSDDKLDFIIKTLGFDSGFNYKKEKPSDALARLAPDGIDIYFENVGGDHLEAALANMKTGGRIPVCGMISGYNTPPEQRPAVKGLANLVSKQITMQGFLVFNPEFGPKYFKEHQETVQKWLADGSFKAKIHTTSGIDKAAEALVGMLKGENFGKAVLKISNS